MDQVRHCSGVVRRGRGRGLGRLTALLTVTLVAGIVSQGAASASLRSAGVFRSDVELQVRQAWARSLERAGAPQAMTDDLRRGAFEGWCPSFEQVLPVDDLNGDGKGDLAGLRCANDHWEPPTLIRTLDGVTGEQLWERQVADPYVWVMSGTASPGGGLLIGSYAYDVVETDPGTVERFSFELTKISGSNTALWTRRFDGTMTFSDAGISAVGVPSDFAPLNTPGGADLLIGSFDAIASSGSWDVMTARAEVVDGVTGASTAPSVVPGEEGIPTIVAASDVNGDAFQDYAAVGYDDSWESPSDVTAVDGLTGRPLWTAGDVAHHDSAIVPLGDVTGDGGEEVAVVTQHNVGTTTTVVLDGATGAVLWERPDAAYRLGDIDGDGTEEVGTRHVFEDHERQVQGVAYEVLDQTGATKQRTEHTVPGGGGIIEVYFVGDVDGDDVVDSRHSVTSFGNDNQAVISGATGQPLWTSAHDWQRFMSARPLEQSVDGAGHDLLEVLEGPVRVAPIDGATGRQLWTATLPGADLYGGFLGADVAEDDRAEIIVTRYEWGGGSNPTRAITSALRAEDGAMLWENTRVE